MTVATQDPISDASTANQHNEDPSISPHGADHREEHAAPLYQLLGKPLIKLPQDLYIPPEALHIFLEAFEGPLDLLLYLIKKQNLDILDIPIVEITKQYMRYIDLLQAMQFELAAEYLVMAAMLAEIKSRMLLPRQVANDLDEDQGIDPRAELVRRLQEYERFKHVAEKIAALPRYERDTFPALVSGPDLSHYMPTQPKVALDEIMKALQTVILRSKLVQKHKIKFEQLSVRERMSSILESVQQARFVPFTQLFTAKEGPMGVVVTLLAILELLRQASLELVQAQPFAEIHIKIREVNHHE